MEIGTTAAGCRVGFFGGSEGAACGGRTQHLQTLGSNDASPHYSQLGD